MYTESPKDKSELPKTEKIPQATLQDGYWKEKLREYLLAFRDKKPMNWFRGIPLPEGWTYDDLRRLGIEIE